MKRFLLLFASFVFLPASLSAQIYADFKTSKGNFTYVLDYVNAPLAVANFIGLAEGSRPWIDEPTGSVKVNKPFYNGLTFHRVINGIDGNPNFQIAQAGSPNGVGTDGPGYTFPDDSNKVFGQPYLLAMANTGPHSNGSQFFLTGTMVIPTLNGKHTVFGELVETATQPIGDAAAVIGSILATPTDQNAKPTTPIVINNITIRRVGGAANSFNINQLNLPAITRPKPAIQYIPNTSTSLVFTPPVSSHTRFYHSQNLINWQSLSYFIDSDDTQATSFNIGIFTGNPTSCFFNLSTVDYPTSALTPSTLNGRILTTINNYGTFRYQFTSEPIVGGANCGTVTHINTGNSTGFKVIILQRDGFGMQIGLQSTLPNVPQAQLHRIGFESQTIALISGVANHSIYDFTAQKWIQINSGNATNATLTR